MYNGWRQEAKAEILVEIRQFRPSRSRRGLRLTPTLAAPESIRMKTMKDTAPTEAVGCTIDGGQEPIMEILV
jgi:hypothetical protein